jgi:hypothetical protein
VLRPLIVLERHDVRIEPALLAKARDELAEAGYRRATSSRSTSS